MTLKEQLYFQWLLETYDEEMNMRAIIFDQMRHRYEGKILSEDINSISILNDNDQQEYSFGKSMITIKRINNA